MAQVGGPCDSFPVRLPLPASHRNVAQQAVANGTLGLGRHDFTRTLFSLGLVTLAQFNFCHKRLGR